LGQGGSGGNGTNGTDGQPGGNDASVTVNVTAC
jgi:hypothetical protein